MKARFTHVKARFAHCAEGQGGGAELSPAAARDSCQKTRPWPQSGSRCSHEAAETGNRESGWRAGRRGRQLEAAPQIRVVGAYAQTDQDRVIPREVGQKSSKQLGAERFPGPQRAGRSLGSFQPKRQARKASMENPQGHASAGESNVPVAKADSDPP